MSVIAKDAVEHASDAKIAWRSLLASAAARYRPVNRFASKSAYFKLALDPVFRHILTDGLIAPRSRVLDIGCGRGLLGSLLLSAGQTAIDGRWPADWPPAPTDLVLTGIDLSARDIAQANTALGSDATFICGDIRRASFPAADVVVILDVLHYISVAEQDDVLHRARHALPAGGRLLLRVGDASRRGFFRYSQWVDEVVTLLRGHRRMPMFGRTPSAWTQRLESLGFTVDARPMSHGTPFANVLLVAHLSKDIPA